MANIKTGLNYYTVDTDRYQDRRIKRLKKDFKCRGIAVYDYILCEIYRVQGCFLVWDANTAFDVAEYFGLEENTVQEVVKYCGSVGLFDKELLSRGIITSASIQRRYTEMCTRAKRKSVSIPESYRLIQEERAPDLIPTSKGACQKQTIRLQVKSIPLHLMKKLLNWKKMSVGLTNYKYFITWIYHYCAAVLTISGYNAWQTGKTGILPCRMQNSTSTHG